MLPDMWPFPYVSAPVLSSRYLRDSEAVPEMEERLAHAGRLSTGSRVVTSDEFMATLWSHGPVVDVDMTPGREAPVEGDFLNAAEPAVSPRHALIEEDGADEPMV
jgi:hypothetical protein